MVRSWKAETHGRPSRLQEHLPMSNSKAVFVETASLLSSFGVAKRLTQAGFLSLEEHPWFMLHLISLTQDSKPHSTCGVPRPQRHCLIRNQARIYGDSVTGRLSSLSVCVCLRVYVDAHVRVCTCMCVHACGQDSFRCCCSGHIHCFETVA